MFPIYPSAHAAYAGGAGLAINEPDGKRAKASVYLCWICGCDARGKFCPPCSADVTETRNRYRLRQRRKEKNK